MLEGKPGIFEGFVEYLSQEKVSGWACKKGDNLPLVVQVLHKAMVLGQVNADVVRQDLKESGRGAGAHAFSFYFPKPIANYFLPGEIQVRIAGTDHFLKATNALTGMLLDSHAVTGNVGSVNTDPDARVIGFQSTSSTDSPKYDVVSAKPHITMQPSILLGEADRRATIDNTQAAFCCVQDKHLLGWAILDEGRSAVLVTVDGKALGEAQNSGGANIPSVQGHPQLAKHGFKLPVPAALLTGSDRKVAMYDAQTGRRIKGVADKLWFAKTSDGKVDLAVPASTPTKLVQATTAFEAQHIPVLPVPIQKVAPGVSPSRSKLAVVAWDMAHNPVGRAFLLANLATHNRTVELVGPIFAFYGGQLWPPIANTTLPLQSFPATDLRSLVAGAVELARNVKCDAVIVGKPRLSSLLIGALIRYANDCPLILDIDDHELSFVKDRTPASFQEVTAELKKDPAEADTPYNDLWTRFAETLCVEADSIIVSNVALRRKFGGIIVRHARDEALFDPALYDRAKIRAEFGYTDDDRIILFLGTPRPHKGIFELADALERLGNPRLALCVIGTVTDKRVLNRFSTYKKARISLHPDQPWERLPELVNMADQAAILQDPTHPIAEFQIPAKLTDSLALGVPVLATLVPPLDDLAHAGVFEAIRNADELDDALRRLAGSTPRIDTMTQGREAFLTEFSYGVNQARLDLALEAAKLNRKRVFPNFERLFRLLEQLTDISLPRLTPAPPRDDRRAPLLRTDKPRDLIFLWKQNDSDIYGRRSDMVSKYLLKTGRVRRVIHFDAPLSLADLDRQATYSEGQSADQGNLVYVNTVRRILKTSDTPAFVRRTYLYRSGLKAERAFGRDLPSRDAYPDFIRQVMREAGVREAPLLWVSPVVFDYQVIADTIRPSQIVADIIDDQRTFPGDSEAHRQRVSGSYATILGEADAVFSNCEPVREAFSDLRSDIKVVPNGAELFTDMALWEKPEDFAHLPRPIIGYVGNLRDRIDLELIEAVAGAFPQATIALIGSAHGRPEVPRMAARWPNIRLLGVRPYHEAQRLIRGFDVAIMPHLKTDQSDRMNPLKLYVYFAVGVPVVTTEVANIGDLAPYVSVAPDRGSFLNAIGDILAGTGRKVADEDRQRILGGLSWERRVSDIWQHMEHAT